MKRLMLLNLLFCSVGLAQSQMENFSITMNGASEVPPNLSSGAGGGVAVYDSTAGTISISIFFSGLSAVLATAQLHDGAPGTIGPMLEDLTSFAPAATSGTFQGPAQTFPIAYFNDLLAGNTYFEITTALFPGGEIRGQVIHTPEPSATALCTFGFAVIALRRFGKRAVKSPGPTH